jgi:hypothetical protein
MTLGLTRGIRLPATYLGQLREEYIAKGQRLYGAVAADE